MYRPGADKNRVTAKYFSRRVRLSFLSFLLVLLSSLQPSLARAGDFEVTPIIGYTIGGGFENSANGNDLDMEDEGSFGVILGFNDQSKAGVRYEFYYSRQSTSLEGDGSAFSGEPRFDIDIEYFHLGGTFGTEGRPVNPYVSGGLGLTHISPERGDSEGRISFSLGGGLRIPLTENIALRFEGRGFGTFFDNAGSIFCADNRCAVQVSSELMLQFTAFSGVTISF